jgi:outer membrane murein-binding lipoprotein Lpp
MTAASPTNVRLNTKKVVALTVAFVLLALLVIGGGITVGLLYHSKSNKVHKLQAQVAALTNQVGSLQSQAQSAFSRGMKAQAADDKAFGLTYKDGFKAGIQSVFGGFTTPWQDGNWYVVQVEHGTNGGHTISMRAPVTNCQLMYVSGNDVYTESQKAC